MSEIIRIDELEFVKLIESREIKRRIELMSTIMTEDLEDSDPLFLVVLNGAFIFGADLVRKFHFECDIEFINANSYDGMERKDVKGVNAGDLHFVKDRNVVVVEDIVDSGHTIECILEACKANGAKTIRIAAFLSKPSAFTKEMDIDYVGFEIAPQFVIGYGLDYNGKGRNLKDIYQIRPIME